MRNEGRVWDIIRHQKWRKNDVDTKSGCCSSLQQGAYLSAASTAHTQRESPTFRCPEVCVYVDGRWVRFMFGHDTVTIARRWLKKGNRGSLSIQISHPIRWVHSPRRWATETRYRCKVLYSQSCEYLQAGLWSSTIDQLAEWVAGEVLADRPVMLSWVLGWPSRLALRRERSTCWREANALCTVLIFPYKTVKKIRPYGGSSSRSACTAEKTRVREIGIRISLLYCWVQI